MSDTRYEQGLAQLCLVEGTTQPGIIQAMAAMAPDLARLTIAFAYGDVYTRPGLTPRHRQLATIGILVALGNAQPQLKFHIMGAIRMGCSASEVIEALIHMAVYAGFPAALNGVFTAQAAFEALQLSPPEPSPPANPAMATDSARYDAGWAALSHIDGEAGFRVVDSLKAIAPDLAHFVVAFAFGDIYTRPGLDLLSREIVTVAALAAMGTATAQLKVHIHGLLNVGGTQEQLTETLIHTAVYAGFPAAINGMLAAQDVLQARQAHAA